VDAGGGCAACCRFILDFAEGGGTDTVFAFEEVEEMPLVSKMITWGGGVPHVFWFFGEEGY